MKYKLINILFFEHLYIINKSMNILSIIYFEKRNTFVENSQFL